MEERAVAESSVATERTMAANNATNINNLETLDQINTDEAKKENTVVKLPKVEADVNNSVCNQSRMDEESKIETEVNNPTLGNKSHEKIPVNIYNKQAACQSATTESKIIENYDVKTMAEVSEDLKTFRNNLVENHLPQQGNKENCNNVDRGEFLEKISDSEENVISDEQVDVNIKNHSQFYESSDSKLDYAIKIDDNDTLSDVDDIKTDSASADSEDSALGSMPPDTVLNEKEEEVPDRSDGSDSGIGSETNEEKVNNFGLEDPTKNDVHLPTEKPNIAHNSDDNTTKNEDTGQESENIVKTPTKSNLKRKYDEQELTDEPECKKKKNGIRFNNVTVYYFPRAQGFSCVPSQGGSTLGMEWEHSHVENFTLAEHAMEQRRLHKQILQQLKNERNSLQGVTFSSSEDSDTEEETSDISDSELDLDSYYFLQPVPTRQRRALLRAAGVRKIEGFEKDECRDIRTSREFCGCACKGVCNPNSCSCSLAGIKCQVDRLNFPCGCTRDGCKNTTGRIEFNPVRVRTHFIHTLMRIGLEKKNEEQQEAAKRQWSGTNLVENTPTAANKIYQMERCHSHDDGLLRDVSLAPRGEAASCVNTGNFNNVSNSVSTNHVNTLRNDLSYSYRQTVTNTMHVSNGSMVHMGEAINRNVHADPYSSNILQGKGPPYSMADNISYDSMSHGVQRFPCEINYTYNQHNETVNHFKNLQSFSASSFEEFAHNSHINMFSHYGHMYVPDYLHKQSSNMHPHNSAMQYHNMGHDRYEMYKNNPETCIENKEDQHYTTLEAKPQNGNKINSIENGDTWFHQNTLMNVDEPVSVIEETAESIALPSKELVQTENPATETTENFGELIKNTMVESVSV